MERNGQSVHSEDDMLDGIMVLIVGLIFMLAMWAAVIYGASLFGPR